MYVHNAIKGIQPYNILTKLQAENNIALYKSYIKLFFKTKLKRKYYNLHYNMYKEYTPFQIRKILKFRCIQLIKLKIEKFKKVKFLNYKNLFRSYNLISVNVNLYKKFKKKRFFKFFINKLLKKQVAANGRLLDGYLNLNLHVLFLRRFKLSFYEFIKKKKNLKKFNF